MLCEKDNLDLRFAKNFSCPPFYRVMVSAEVEKMVIQNKLKWALYACCVAIGILAAQWINAAPVTTEPRLPNR